MVVRADTVHHVQAHKGDEVLFFSGQLESLCSECHNSGAQSEERMGYSTEAGTDGWPVDPRHPANRKP
jgi:5-methylcytosine-specific restriction enzyme A